MWVHSVCIIIASVSSVVSALGHLHPSVLPSLDPAPVLHFTLTRRGGTFAPTALGCDYVNVGYLSQELERTEARFNLTQRQVEGNKLVRKAKDVTEDKYEGALMGEVAEDGIWYAKFNIGSPPQEIEVDLNLLTSDFYILITTSRRGSRYDDLFSHSIQKSLGSPYPTCLEPTDVFHLPNTNTSLPISFAYCRPPKFSRKTLGASGSTLGLAPSEHIRQTHSKSLLNQFLDVSAIQRPVFSLMLINGQEGVLSIGGTASKAIEMVESQTKSELDSLAPDQQQAVLPSGPEDNLLIKRSRTAKGIITRQRDWDDGWTWSEVQGAEGWWQTLMRGVWIDGSKVLTNQAVVIDINSPFILAPPPAMKAFYASISGSRPLDPPYSNFYVFPCLNPPSIQFEFAGTNFPFMQGGRGAEFSGIPGGKFSLGRLSEGSGYCLGAVVETRMGIKEERDEVVQDNRKGHQGRSIASRGGLGGNGMRDVWVIGEGFFRGVGGVFDLKDRKVGFKAY